VRDAGGIDLELVRHKRSILAGQAATQLQRRCRSGGRLILAEECTFLRPVAL